MSQGEGAGYQTAVVISSKFAEKLPGTGMADHQSEIMFDVVRACACVRACVPGGVAGDGRRGAAGAAAHAADGDADVAPAAAEGEKIDGGLIRGCQSHFDLNVAKLFTSSRSKSARHRTRRTTCNARPTNEPIVIFDVRP